MKFKLKSNIPSGFLLLKLRGAVENLKESLTTTDRAFILRRRIELSELVSSVGVLDPSLSYNDSTVSHRLSSNLGQVLIIAKAILHDASSRLAQCLVSL